MTLKRIQPLIPIMTTWRHRFHACPETAFEERETAAFVAETLSSFGIDVHCGLGKTGVVGTLTKGSPSGPCLGFRADMDALDLAETGTPTYRSTRSGKMHACGHDGHMAMLLGAAKYLAEEGRFNGRIHFIFQPAEESEGGAKAMIDDGLFDKFPCDAVFGMHNFPNLPFGSFALRPGPMMAACDIFTIEIEGTGGHAAMPHLAKDPIVAAAFLVEQLQSIVGRSVDPLESAVVSVTRIQGGTNFNVIPAAVVLQGTTRHFEPHIQDLVEKRLKEIAAGTALAQGIEIIVRYERGYPALVNSAEETSIAARAAARVQGEENVNNDSPPVMGSEDFAFMLQKCPGAYIGIGGGDPDNNGMLHQSGYDFNDALLPIGAAYWVCLAEEYLTEPR